MVVLDDVQYMCARDVIMHVNGKNNKQACQVWDRLPDENKEELSSHQRNFRFPGQGQSEQPVLTFQGILKLVMWIGGKNAKKYRASMVSILSRYYAGDGTLTDEIEANAKSTSPIQQMAKASLAIEHVPVEGRSLEYKRKLEELEISKLDLEIKSAAYDHVMKVTTSYRELCKDKDMDAPALQILKENLLNKAILERDSEAPDEASPKPDRKRQKREHNEPVEPAYQQLRSVLQLTDLKAFLGDMWEEPESDDSMMEWPD